MLSVINRGTTVGEEVEGLPYRIIQGYETESYDGLPLKLIKLNGIEPPLNVGIDVTMKQGHIPIGVSEYTVDTNVLSVSVQPVIKSGYTPITVNPKES